MKIKQILFVVAAFTVMVAGASANVSTVAAIDQPECAILPDSICGSSNTSDIEGSAIMRTLIWIVNTLSVGVGVAAVAAIAYAGFLYTTSRGSPEQAKKAITMITNTVVGVLLYIFMWALINFLVPGGIMYGGVGSSGSPAPPPPPGQGGPMNPH